MHWTCKRSKYTVACTGLAKGLKTRLHALDLHIVSGKKERMQRQDTLNPKRPLTCDNAARLEKKAGNALGGVDAGQVAGVRIKYHQIISTYKSRDICKVVHGVEP